MKHSPIIIFLLLSSIGLVKPALSQVTRNQTGDSIRILFYLEYENKPYRIAKFSIYKGNNLLINSREPVDGIVEILLPTTTFVQSRKNLYLRVSHKYDRRLDQLWELGTSFFDIYDGICGVSYTFIINQPIVDQSNGRFSKTITSEEIEKGAY